MPFSYHLRNAGILSLLLFIVFFGINWVFASQPWNWAHFFSYLVYTFIITNTLYLGNSYGHDFVSNKLNLSWKKPIQKIGVGLIAITAISVALGLILFFGFELYEGESIATIIGQLSGNYFKGFMQRAIWISVFIAIVFIFLDYISYIKSIKETKQKIVIQRVNQTNEALKAQIGPHFLFNSLNVLSGLTEENPEKAQDFIADLSTIYRYVLEQAKKELVTVQEELDFAKNYLRLIKMRFEKGLEFEIDDALYNERKKIVPLSLQLLLENCIKHNQISSSNPLNICIKKEGNSLVVQNNLSPKKQYIASTQTGLKNIKEKYALLGNAGVEINKTNEQFEVKLPLLLENNYIMENYNEQDYREAKERVDDLRGFYWHLAVFIAVNCFFIFINLNAGGNLWFYWPLLGWGIGLFFHAVGVFGFFNVSKSWEEKKIKAIMEKKKKERENFGK